MTGHNFQEFESFDQVVQWLREVVTEGVQAMEKGEEKGEEKEEKGEGEDRLYYIGSDIHVKLQNSKYGMYVLCSRLLWVTHILKYSYIHQSFIHATVQTNFVSAVGNVQSSVQVVIVH